MKKRIVLLCSLVFGSIALCAGDIFVGFCERGTVEVPAGESITQIGVVGVDPKGTLCKTGTGLWTLPWASVFGDLQLDVRDGTVALTSDGTTPAVEKPLSVMANAAFWVTTASGLVVTNTADGRPVASRWLDCREVDRNPDLTEPYHFPYAEPDWDASRSSYPLFGVPPAVVDAYDHTGVYFGKMGSSQSMTWKTPDGSAMKLSNIRQVFIVTAVSNSWGFALGSVSGDPADFHVGSTGGSLAVPYWTSYSGDSKAISDGSRTYVDGRFVDARRVAPQTGLQLIEVQLFGRDAHAANFFSDRGISGRSGGDYLYEVLIFTNQVSEVDCQKIRRYLMTTWGTGSKQGAQAVCVASGAEVRMDVSEETTLKSIVSLGEGTLVKTGTGSMQYAFQTNRFFNGELRIDGGAVQLNYPAALALSGGSRIVAELSKSGLAVTRTVTEASDRIEQIGSGAVTVQAIPKTVTSYSVGTGGTLCLAAPEAGSTLVPGSVTTGYVPNASFEMEAETFTDLAVFTGDTRNGWTGIRNPDSAWDDSTGADRKVFFYNKARSSAQWPCSYYAPDGEAVLAIKGDCTAYTTVTLFAPGIYELSFKISGRYGFDSQNQFDILFGKTMDTLASLGTVWPSSTPYRTVRFKVPAVEAGDYILRFQAKDLCRDGCSFFDDVRLTLIAEETETEDWAVPNGSFEQFAAPAVGSFSTINTNVGWTFSQGDWEGATYPAAGAICVGTKLGYGEASIVTADDVPYGSWALALCKPGAFAQTTFTPPAGAWCLRAEGKSWCGGWTSGITIRNYSQVKARVIVGSETNELGVVDIPNFLMEPLTWPVSFAVPAGVPVTLCLEECERPNGSMAILDNLVLSPAAANELVKNGSFESGVADPWVFSAIPDFDENGEKSYSAVDIKSTEDDFYCDNYGAEPGDGRYVLKIVQIGLAAQTIEFPTAGLYRLRFLAHSRPDGPNGSWSSVGRNPLRAWISRGAETNMIGWTAVESTNFVSHSFLFRVPEAGAWTFGLQGMNSRALNNGPDRTALVDCVSIKAATPSETPDLPVGLSLDLAADARLVLSYPGTQEVFSVRISGLAYTGILTAETCDNITGIGALNVKPRGTILLLR